MSDSAEPNRQYEFLAVGGDVPHFGLLPEGAAQFWDTMQKELSRRYATAAAPEKDSLRRMNGCIDKLSASLMQVGRLRDRERQFLTDASQSVESGSPLAVRGGPLLADFEGLLLQGRAALDRLTWLLARLLKNNCSSYRSLGPILRNARTDSVAQLVLPIYEAVIPWFDGIFGKFESGDSLRDLVGHRSALTEGVEVSLGAFGLGNHRLLLFDCEVWLPSGPCFPVLGTARNAAKYLSYAILSSLAVIMDVAPESLDSFDPQWKCSCVQLTRFLVEEPPGSPLTENHIAYVRHMTLDGFEMAERNVKPELYTHAIECK